MDAKKIESLYRYTNLPELHWKCCVAKIPEGRYKTVVEDWVINFKDKIGGPGLFLYGPYGNGKSGIAAILMKAAIANGIAGYWLDFKMLQKISINSDKYMFNEHMTVMDRVIETDFLIIDEVQIQNNLHWPLGVLDDIVRLRHQHKRTTILTTNTNPSLFKSTGLTKSLYEILKEACISVKVEGINFRDKYDK